MTKEEKTVNTNAEQNGDDLNQKVEPMNQSASKPMPVAGASGNDVQMNENNAPAGHKRRRIHVAAGAAAPASGRSFSRNQGAFGNESPMREFLNDDNAQEGYAGNGRYGERNNYDQGYRNYDRPYNPNAQAEGYEQRKQRYDNALREQYRQNQQYNYDAEAPAIEGGEPNYAPQAYDGEGRPHNHYGARTNYRQRGGGGYGHQRNNYGGQHRSGGYDNMQGGYGQPRNNYGQQRGGGYGQPRNNYGQQRGGGYGQPRNNYGQQRGGGYGQPRNNYGQQRGGSYGQPRNNYGPQCGYDNGMGRGGYGQGGMHPRGGKPYPNKGYNQQGGAPRFKKQFKPRQPIQPIKYQEVVTDPNEEIRLNKFLANAGVCSRREADDLIKNGLVTVNGEVITELGSRVTRQDEVMYNGKPVQIESKVYVLLNKPHNCVTTSDDPECRKTVMDIVKNACPERIYPVGRLDRNTTGVLLITNDGDLAAKLTHPSFMKKKIYHVWLDKGIPVEDMQRIADGIELEDGEIHADALSYIKDDDNTQVGIEIHSGRNRIVRRIFEHLGYHVVKLDRVYFAGLTKKNLPRGKWRYLNEQEVNNLRMGAFE